MSDKAIMYRPGHLELNCCRLYRRGWAYERGKGGVIVFKAEECGVVVQGEMLYVPYIVDEIFAEMSRRIG